MQKAKETASNIAASAQSGLDKTKATMQEKVEKVTAHDPMQKEMATQKKEERIHQAEYNKQEAREHNAVAAVTGTGFRAGAGAGAGTGTGPGTGPYSHSTTGATGQQTGAHQMSALPGHGTGQPTGHVTEGVVGAHPIGTNTGTGRTTTHNTHVGGGGTNTNTGGYGTGGANS